MTIKIAHPAFSIAFDRPTQVMRVHLVGFWTDVDEVAYEAALRGALTMLPAEGCRPGDQLMLVDITQHTVQSASALEFFAKITNDKIISGRRSALVITSALVRMQAKRVAPHYAMFDDQEAALAWLLAEPA